MKPYARNPRRITTKRVARLTDTLARLGDLGGIVHNLDTDEIIGGNQRMAVFRDGQAVVTETLDTPDDQGTVAHGFIIWRNHRYAYRQVRWDEATAAEANIAANIGAGSWDWDALSGWNEPLAEWGFDADMLAEWRTDAGALDAMLTADKPALDDPGAQIDKAAELREKWGVESGQLWQLGEHRLICGDCTDAEVVARVMGGERAGMVFIDPPYMTFGSSTGKLEPSDFIMLAPFWDIVVKTAQGNLADGRPAFICCDWRSFPTLFTQAFKHMTVKNLIVWDLGGALKMGSDNFRSSYELLVYATNSSFGRNWHDKQKGAWKIDDRSVRDLWTIKQSEAAPGKSRDHASQKPVELVEMAIKHGSLDDDIIFDYFSGSGTTIIAAENLGRRCRAVEIDAGYVAVALERFYQMTGVEPVLLEAA